MSDYKFLFPFEKIPRGSRVVIYGAGEVGWEYYRQLRITQYAEVVGIVDRRAGNMDDFPATIYLPKDIHKLEFDYIVLAFRASAYHESVRCELERKGIKNEKIIYILPRREPVYTKEPSYSGNSSKGIRYSYELDCLSVAIKVGAAIGDNIFQKNFIKALAELDSSLKIDIYSPVSESYLPWLYKDCPNVNAFIQDGGGLYSRKCLSYDFSLQIWVFVSIDHINEHKLKKEYIDFYNKVRALERKIKESDMDYNMPMFNYFARSIKQGKNAYTVYDFDGELGINDKKTDIILEDEWELEFKKLELPSKYITVNYGNGITLKNSKTVAKQWPYENFEELIREFKNVYPDIGIIQLGADGAYHLHGVEWYVLGKPLELVAHVLKKSLLHVDIEGGLVHLAAQLGTKCIVLFGPTQEQFFGYEQNINIQAGACHDCYGMYRDFTRCVRDMDKPECMYSITPKIVFKEVKNYLDKTL